MGTSDAASPPLDVLVVDDEPLIRWILRRGLTARGHHVSEASDGAGAIRELHAHPAPFDLVLLDYQLPDTHDLTLLAEIRRAAPASPVVMMSGCTDGSMRTEARIMGACDVVDKPFEMEEIVSLVESAARTGHVSSSGALRA